MCRIARDGKRRGGGRLEMAAVGWRSEVVALVVGLGLVFRSLKMRQFGDINGVLRANGKP